MQVLKKKNELENFLKGHSTTTNLLEAINVWTEALMLMHGINTNIIYLDYASIWHSATTTPATKDVWFKYQRESTQMGKWHS